MGGCAIQIAAQAATKQTTWDDFIAVAEDLIRRKITSPRRLGAIGGSQGRLLVGAAITQRPELFNAAIIEVPLLDMLRYTWARAPPGSASTVTPPLPSSVRGSKATRLTRSWWPARLIPLP